jgi:hypothetical protein
MAGDISHGSGWHVRLGDTGSSMAPCAACLRSNSGGGPHRSVFRGAPPPVASNPSRKGDAQQSPAPCETHLAVLLPGDGCHPVTMTRETPVQITAAEARENDALFTIEQLELDDLRHN